MHWIDVAVVCAFLVLTLYIGYKSGGKIRTLKEFSVSDRNFSNIFMVATVFATWMGGDDLLGTTERVWAQGIIVLPVLLFDMVGLFIMAKFAIPAIKHSFPNAISAPEILKELYGRPGQLMSACALVLLCLAYTSLQVECIGRICTLFFGTPLSVGIVIGALVVVIYSVFGGVKAVVWTDFLQFGVMMVAIPVIASIALVYVGGIDGLLQKVPPHLMTLDVPHDVAVDCITLSICALLPSLGGVGLQRVLMARNAAQASKSILTSAFIYIPVYTMLVLISLCAVVAVPSMTPGTAFLGLVNACIPIGFKGIAIAGIMAVLMSTADSNLTVGAVVVINDIMSQFRKSFDERTKVILVRLVTFAFGVAAILCATSYGRLIDYSLYLGSFWLPAAAIPIALYAFFNIRLSQKQYVFLCSTTWVYILLHKAYAPAPYKVVSYLAGWVVPVVIGFIMHKFWPYNKPLRVNDDALDAEVTVPEVVSLPKSESFWSSILKSSTESVQRHGAKYLLFGSFVLVNYMVPMFMWTNNSTGYQSVSMIRIFCGALGFLLCSLDACPEKLKKYIPLLWHFSIMMCLPFTAFYMMFIDGPTLYWIVNLNMAFVLSLVLTERRIAVNLFILGFILAVIANSIAGLDIAWCSIDPLAYYITVFFALATLILYGSGKKIGQDEVTDQPEELLEPQS